MGGAPFVLVRASFQESGATFLEDRASSSASSDPLWTDGGRGTEIDDSFLNRKASLTTALASLPERKASLLLGKASLSTRRASPLVRHASLVEASAPLSLVSAKLCKMRASGIQANAAPHVRSAAPTRVGDAAAQMASASAQVRDAARRIGAAFVVRHEEGCGERCCPRPLNRKGGDFIWRETTISSKRDPPVDSRGWARLALRAWNLPSRRRCFNQPTPRRCRPIGQRPLTTSARSLRTSHVA